MAEALGTASQALRELPSASYPATSTIVLPVLTSGFRHSEPSQVPRCTTPLQDCLHFILLFPSNFLSLLSPSVQFSSVTQSCLNLCDPMDCSKSGFPDHHHSQSLFKLMSIELVMPSNHLILCCPLLLLSSIFPSIRVAKVLEFQLRHQSFQ